MKKLSKTQQELWDKKNCPTCGLNARFIMIEDDDTKELIILCENCDTTIDRNGGAIH